MEKNMSDLEKDMKVNLIIEEYREGKYSKELVERELRLMGMDRFEIQKAIGEVVQLNG